MDPFKDTGEQYSCIIDIIKLKRKKIQKNCGNSSEFPVVNFYQLVIYKQLVKSPIFSSFVNQFLHNQMDLCPGKIPAR
jgi:hypothetical protein